MPSPRTRDEFVDGAADVGGAHVEGEGGFHQEAEGFAAQALVPGHERVEGLHGCLLEGLRDHVCDGDEEVGHAGFRGCRAFHGFVEVIGRGVVCTGPVEGFEDGFACLEGVFVEAKCDHGRGPEHGEGHMTLGCCLLVASGLAWRAECAGRAGERGRELAGARGGEDHHD